MPAPYGTGAAILQHVAGSGTPSVVAADVAWADICADAIEGTIATRLGDGAFTPSASQEAALVAAALQDGAALYVARKSPGGVVVAPDGGEIVRLNSDILRACERVLYPLNPGIG